MPRGSELDDESLDSAVGDEVGDEEVFGVNVGGVVDVETWNVGLDSPPFAGAIVSKASAAELVAVPSNVLAPVNSAPVGVDSRLSS